MSDTPKKDMDWCKDELKEQIALLWHHTQDARGLDYQFLRNHALTVLQLAEQLADQMPTEVKK